MLTNVFFSSMTFVFICPRKISSNFGYSLALSIVNNFTSDKIFYFTNMAWALFIASSETSFL